MVPKTRSLPDTMAEHLAALVRAEIGRRFPTPPGGKPVSQAKVAEDIGIAQGVLSDIINARGGVGVAALLSLRAWMRVSIDELLNLPPLHARTDADEFERIRQKTDADLAFLRSELARVEQLALAKTRPR